jgi:hypothetical protein
MTMSTPKPPKALPLSRSNAALRRCVPTEDSIPTIEEAKRRLAAAGPDPWLTPKGIEALAEAEEASGGWIIGPADWRAARTV